METFAIFTEPGMETVGDISCSDGLHWHYIPPANPSFEAMLRQALKITNMTFKALAGQEPNKRDYAQLIELLNTLAQPKCARCEKLFPPVDEWTQERALFLDSLSGLNMMALTQIAGDKPVKALPDWGVAMDSVERIVTKLTVSCKCPVVLTGHLEREQDEVTGGVQVMVSTLGRKLAPRLPRYFSDVIQAVREVTDFYWSTTTFNVDLKTRNLPWGNKLEPSYLPLFQSWQNRGGAPDLPGPKILLLGATGTGKTYSLHSLVETEV